MSRVSQWAASQIGLGVAPQDAIRSSPPANTSPPRAGAYWWNGGVAPTPAAQDPNTQFPGWNVPNYNQPPMMGRGLPHWMNGPVNPGGMIRFKTPGMPNFGGPMFPQQQQQPYPFQLPNQFQFGNFYAPTPMGDAQNSANSTVGANFLAPPRRY